MHRLYWKENATEQPLQSLKIPLLLIMALHEFEHQ